MFLALLAYFWWQHSTHNPVMAVTEMFTLNSTGVLDLLRGRAQNCLSTFPQQNMSIDNADDMHVFSSVLFLCITCHLVPLAFHTSMVMCWCWNCLFFSSKIHVTQEQYTASKCNWTSNHDHFVLDLKMKKIKLCNAFLLTMLL